GYDMGTIENNGETMPHAKEWDYFIATDWPNREYIRTALNLKIPRLLIGSSRSDVLVNMDKNMYYSIRKSMGINEGEKVVLYAPTFRENDFNLEKIDLKIKELCRLKDVRVILRLHPEVKNRIDISEYDNTVIDGNVYTDIYVLYMAADILITDYSSVSIEYSLLRRPILFYMYDLEEYKSERNFYFDYLDHLAGPVIKTEEELIYAVQHIDEIQENFKEEYQAYNQRYNEKNDGHVCERFMKLLQSGFFSKPGNDITT
ncbi:MAG: CDP-glycerol glycerophosphotransferase family protein, partial [Clostridium sp.]